MADARVARARAVTFDYGQTLAELDHDFLAARVRIFGGELDAQASRAAGTVAWEAYGAAKSLGHAAAWKRMMHEFLRAGGLRPSFGAAPPDFAEQMVQELWLAQPAVNLWRKPIPGMFELVHELVAQSIPVAVISNSEGRLAELLAELGEEKPFRVIVDSGRLGIDKPDARIFEHTARALDLPLSEIVHVGDAWEADVMGAARAGAQAVWFAPVDQRALPRGVVSARDATELRSVLLEDFGLGLENRA
ncbi:MAG TPA: HAD family hydrolase [Polyangiaceae bacterium]|nr:HAD family hydrolase [Polyangiaceae bacterium]